MNNHPLFGTRYFKYHYHIFSIRRVKKDEWWLYARHEATEEVYFLGKVLKEHVKISEIKLDWALNRGRDKLFDIAVEQFKVGEQMERMVERLEKRSHLCNNKPMPVQEKYSRNEKIVQLVEEGESYGDIAKMPGMPKTKSTIHKIYHRDKHKYGKGKLSPTRTKKVLDRSPIPAILKVRHG